MLILVTLAVTVLLKPAHTETNILKAIFSSTQDNILVDLSSKFSSKINVIVESDNPEKSQETAIILYSKLDKDKMHTSDADISKVLNKSCSIYFLVLFVIFALLRFIR